MFEDTDQDLAVRDYAIQHLGAWYPEAPEEELPRIRETFIAALQEADSSIAGTSLLALHALEEEGAGGLDANVIAEAALQLAWAEETGELTRITAAQVLAKRDAPSGFELAVKWAMDPENSYTLRASAISALGASRSPEARDLLEHVAAANDGHLRPAIEHAFRRLDAVQID